MKNEYENLKIEVIAFDAEDVILTSETDPEETRNEGPLD